MITTFSFYEGKYYGDIIPELNFYKYESKAEDDINRLTNGRLLDLSEYSDAIQKAVCELADVNYQLDMAMNCTGANSDGSGKLVKSKSSGNESISYDTGSNMYMEAAMDIRKQERIKYNVVSKHLSGTGLLYAGV